MKKFISLVLALLMMLCLCTTALADGTADVTTTRTYNGYKLLDLTTSLKCDHTGEGATHTEACYTYAYTVNTKYEALLEEVAGEKDILDYLAEQSGDTDAGYGSLRAVADAIYRKILEKGLAADAPNLTGTESIDQGYWLFADVTDVDDENEANSLVVLDTKGQEALTIKTKVGLPTIVKKVKDLNDSTGAETDWQDSADYDILDTVPFQLTLTLPENLAGYTEYQLIIHDTLSSGLTLDADSFKVMMGNTDVTGNFAYAPGTAGQFTYTCANVLAINGVTKDSTFVVTYDATLNNGAVIGAAGNPNEVYLEFSNNPYGTGTGKTQTDKVTVFTYQLSINKIDANEDPLKGAGFTLYKKNGEAYTAIGGELVGGDMTTFTWVGLDDGDYKLEETTVPDGYNKMEDKLFTITAEHSEESDAPVLTGLTSTLGAAVKDNSGTFTGVIEEDIVNQSGTILPETGAKGTMMLIGGGSVLVLLAAIFMVTRKKMSVYED